MYRICTFLIVLSALVLTACGPRYAAPVADRNEAGTPTYYVVRKGDTLFSIAWEHGLEYKALARRNAIPPPYRIYPGQRIYLREDAAPPRGNRTVEPSRRSTPAVSGRAHTAAPSAATAPEDPDDKPVGVWHWPTQGTVIRAFDATESGKKGIGIAGAAGQPIMAAADGKVVYTGNGLVRYGNLIIVKHNRSYFSAYAHNRSILVKEGDNVKQGQKIAEMGDTGTDRHMLHFEIRKNGKPVDPLNYLKK